MRFRTPLFALAFTLVSFALPYAAHASIPFFGPIVPNSSTCAAGWGMVILVINNLISFLITIAIVFVAPLMIAYAGFLFVVNPVNSGGISKAKGILLNTIIGIVIALAGYLIVDALMAALYNPNAGAGGWAQIINWNGDQCLPQAGTEAGAGLTPGVSPPSITPGGFQPGKAPGPCASNNTACSTSAIQQGAQALNMKLSAAQAAALSCIAMTESTGNPATPNSSTGACGTFQITTKPGNWSIPSLHQGSCSTSSSCNDAQCNLQTALLLYNQRGYQPWTGKNPDGTYWNPNAVACVQQYGT